MKVIFTAIRTAIVMLAICSIIYPLSLLGVGQVLFPNQADGSMVSVNGEVIGSSLIGQSFTDAGYFHGRVSSINYNTYDKNELGGRGTPSSGSANLSVTNTNLTIRLNESIIDFIKNNPTVKKEEIPALLLSSSGSGLDPEISPEAAFVQIPRISTATGINEDKLMEIVNSGIVSKSLGMFGERRVNVLLLNIEIDKLTK